MNTLPDNFQNKRIAYLKHGNACTELQTMIQVEHGSAEGAFTYVGQFFRLCKKSPLLILSYAHEKSCFSNGHWQAIALDKEFTGTINHLINSLQLSIQTLQQLIKFRPDIILCAAYRSPLWICYIYHRLCKIPFIHSRHNILKKETSITGKLLASIDNWIISKSGHVICHGQHIKQQLLDIGLPSNQVTVFRPSYRPFFEAAQKESKEDITDDGQLRIVCFVGRIEKDKGVFDLLTACENRLRKDPKLRLFYLGQGKALSQLKEQITSLTLTGSINCLGWVNHDRMAAIIKQCHFVITPSRSTFPEGFPKSAVEPLIIGKPVIAPDYGPFSPFIIHEINGLIFKSDSPEDLAVKINRLLDDDKLYQKLSRGAFETGQRLIDPETTFTEALTIAFRKTNPPNQA